MSPEPASDDRAERLHATVTGRVQGVGYRYTTRRMAAGFGLSGWVANRPDGSVEVIAEGDADALTRLEAFLRVGPPAARVDACRVRRSASEGAFTEFEIR